MGKAKKVAAAARLGYGFISRSFLPKGKDEYYLRNAQSARPANHWRALRADELDALIAGGNASNDWGDVRVADGFDPRRVTGCRFSGLVRIGRIGDMCLESDGLVLPAGLADSHIIACDIGDDAAIRGVRYLAHYIIGDRALLLNIDEMLTTDTARFGAGCIKEGEDEDARTWLELINETGGRGVLPFDGMIPADAFLWAKYRQDDALLERFRKMTDAQAGVRRGEYGEVARECVIRSCRLIRDVRFGEGACVAGAGRLQNLTINSSLAERTHIGDGVELEDGVVGRGCHVCHGSKAVRFVLGDGASLKFGARLMHTVLGDNSTVACCEVAHNLIFPAHEQHHNNSFLIAALLKGQSNVAAGATVGSNHNSRSNDGEVDAGRGFWPGLCVSLKHSCRFASFTLLAKGDYAYEMDIPLPFSLVSDDPTDGRLLVMPAYWWTYNMYALARNSWKFPARDKRRAPAQKIEFDALAPDTAEEMFNAMRLLELWAGRARLRAGSGQGHGHGDVEPGELAQLGRRLLGGDLRGAVELEVLGEHMECSHRKVIILKAREGYRAYRQMLHLYAVRNLLDYLDAHPRSTVATMSRALAGQRQTQWVNLGGQLAAGDDVDELRRRIRTGKLKDWAGVHAAYDELWRAYPLAKQRHAFATLLELHGEGKLDAEAWAAALDRAERIQAYVNEQVYRSRKKDYDNPFRHATFADADEMHAVVGAIEDNSFVLQTRKETALFRRRLHAAAKRV